MQKPIILKSPLLPLFQRGKALFLLFGMNHTVHTFGVHYTVHTFGKEELGEIY
jgi:hypothetical protein